MRDAIEIGIISDTHGLLRPEAIEALRGVEHIFHGGDVGGDHILEPLRALAPVLVVRGNTDTDAWGRSLPARVFAEVGRERLLMYHGHLHLGEDAAHHDAKIIITGHTHVPKIDWRHGVLHVNPGSAGPRRPGLPVTLARLTVNPHGEHAVRLIELV